jgi:hypothetical protein
MIYFDEPTTVNGTCAYCDTGVCPECGHCKCGGCECPGEDEDADDWRDSALTPGERNK